MLTSRLVLIDDDELSRELLAIVAEEAGFEARSFASGGAALAGLRRMDPPAVVLSDMQMPGVSGDDLARRLREACGAGTVLLAMSGSTVAEDRVRAFDGFVLKPVSATDLRHAIEQAEPGSRAQGVTQPAAGAKKDVAESAGAVLSEAVYEKLAASMPAAQVSALYAMCLKDARKRLEAMRLSAFYGDAAEYRRAAHAIKGGCGMVGALELTRLAAEMEETGLTEVHENGPNQSPLNRFESAIERLERMLEDKARAGRAAGA